MEVQAVAHLSDMWGCSGAVPRHHCMSLKHVCCRPGAAVTQQCCCSRFPRSTSCFGATTSTAAPQATTALGQRLNPSAWPLVDKPSVCSDHCSRHHCHQPCSTQICPLASLPHTHIYPMPCHHTCRVSHAAAIQQALAGFNNAQAGTTQYCTACC